MQYQNIRGFQALGRVLEAIATGHRQHIVYQMQRKFDFQKRLTKNTETF